MTLDRETTISRIRLYNYNASRAHANRGARHAELRLNGSGGGVAWSGELRCSSDHEMDKTDLLFTEDTSVLAKLKALDMDKVCADVVAAL